jgi:phosphatidate cytidylyltransferase
MDSFDMAPHWDGLRTRVAVSVLGALLAMSAVGGWLRSRARTPIARVTAADFQTRALGWWLILAVFTPAALAGGWVLLALLVVASVIAWTEFARLRPGTGFARADFVWVTVAIGAHFVASLHSAIIAAATDGILLAVMLVVSVASRRDTAGRPGWRALGFILCVLPLSVAGRLALEFGIGWLVFVTAVAQAGDIAQYLAGKKFGRHRLAERISPNKTWEGLAGGLLVAGLLGVALAPVIGARGLVGALWGVAVALSGTAGGLVMSAAKRSQGAKNFGAWIPGQGGLLDRFDSLCGAAVAVYLSLLIAGH